MTPLGGGIELALTGNDYAHIYEQAQMFAQQIMQAMPGLGRAQISYQPTQPQLRVNIDRIRAQELGVSLDDIAST